MGDRVIDDKLYKIVQKDGTHLVESKKTDGAISALQFDNSDNTMKGPIDLIEVSEDELRRIGIIQKSPTIGQTIISNVVVPVVSEIVKEGLNIGLSYFERWIEEEAIPKTREKAKELNKKAKVAICEIKYGLYGKEIKAVKLLREVQDKKLNGTKFVVTNNVAAENTNEQGNNSKEYTDKEFRSVEEVQAIINTMRNSAITLVACIRMLSNTLVRDNGENKELSYEMQKEFEILTTKEIMEQINQLLEDKNKNLLDQTSLMILTAFRDGNFIVDNKSVPIKNFISNLE